MLCNANPRIIIIIIINLKKKNKKQKTKQNIKRRMVTKNIEIKHKDQESQR